MAYKGPHGIMILEGLDPVRRRPAMYIGADEAQRSTRALLLEYVVNDITHGSPPEVSYSVVAPRRRHHCVRWQPPANRALWSSGRRRLSSCPLRGIHVLAR